MEDIKEKVKDIIREQFDIRVNNMNEDKDVSLLSGEVSLYPKQMVYMVLYIEKLYDIKFSENDFDNAEFYSLNGFCKTIYGYVENK